MLTRILQTSFVVFLSWVQCFGQANIPFTQRKTWDGPYDIKMIAAPNLEAVYVDEAQAASNKLKADSIIRYSTMVMSGDLFEINNRYKGGSPFNSYDVPLGALACKDYNAPCFEGLTPNTPNSSCPVRYNNPTTVSKMVAMTYADYDNDMTTYSSSMSLLDISNCSEIEAAYLYWTGNFGSGITLATPTASYNGNGSVFNVSATSGYDKVLFKRPGGNYQNVTAVSRYVDDNSFVCVSDVTTLVRGTGGGQFWVANLQSYPHEGGGGSTSGWVLVVVFRSPLSPPRLISLWDGFKGISSGNSETFNLTGLQAPATADFKSYVGFAVLDGENIASQLDGTTPEGLGFQTSGGPKVSINPFCDGSQPKRHAWTKKGYPALTNGSDNVDGCKVPLFDGSWATVCDGISSSHITSYSEVNDKNGNEIVRLPSNPNTLGFDAHHVKLPDGAVAPNSTSATLTIEAGPQGGTSPFMAYIAIERLQPKLVLTKQADKDQAAPGDTRTYTLKIKNEGNQDSFGNDLLTDTLDPVTKYLTGSLTARMFTGGNPSTITLTAPTINNVVPDRQGLSFTIPVIKRKDSLELTFKVNVLPVTDAVANNYYQNLCKRTIENVAWIDYKKNVANERLKSKSNSGECNDGSEVIIIITGLGGAPTILTEVNASAYRNDFAVKHVRKQIFIQNHAGVADTAKYIVYDQDGNRVYSFDKFPANGNEVTYTAYRDLSGATCQDVVQITFKFCTPPTAPTYATVPAICKGGSVTLNKTGAATGAFYWYTQAAGGTGLANNFTISPTTTVTYYLIDSLLNCSSNRTAVQITVNPVPADPTAPSIAAICAGSNVTLTTSATAAATFFWYDQQTGGVPQTNPYTPSPAPTGNTTYYLIDSSATTHCASARVAVNVTVNPVPTAPADPGISVCSGNTATLTATGTATGTFFWYAKAAGGSPINNGTVTSALTSNATYYLIDSIPSGCKSTRTPVTIAVGSPINPGVIGTSTSICSNTGFNLTEATAASGGDGTYTYKWKSSTDGTTYTDLGAPDANTYSSSGLTTTTFFVREVSSSTCTPQTSNAVKITILPGLNPGSIGSDATICYNGSSSLTSSILATGGVGTFAYQWESSTDNGTTWNPISSASNPDYTASGLTTTTQFRRSVISGTGTCSKASTPAVSITVHPNFTSGGTIQTDKATICSGQSVNLTSIALPTGGTGTYTYAWKQSDGTNTTDLTSTTADASNVSLTATTQTVVTFTRTATSGSCGSQTATVQVTVKPLVNYTVTLDPVAAICASDPNPVVFTATANPSTIGIAGAFKWTIAGTEEPGATSSTLSKQPSSLTDGAQVVATLLPSADVCPSQPSYASAPLTLVVATKVIPTITMPAPDPVCEGTAVTFTATANGEGPTPTYEWLVNGTNATGASTTSATYTYNPVNGDEVSVSVTTSSNCKSPIPAEQVATVKVPVTMKPIVTPSVTITADKLTPCENDLVTFTVTGKTNEGAMPSYRWFVGIDPQLGNDSETFSTTSLTGTQVVTVELTSNAECVNTSANPATSNQVTVTVTPRVAPKTGIFASPGGTICAGQSVTFSASQTTADTANGGSGVKYEWYVGNSGVLGTTPTFTTSTLANGDIVKVNYISSLRCLINDNATATNQLTMKVNTPVVSITGAPTFCSDDNTGVLTAVDNGSGTDQGTGAQPSFTWTTSAGTFMGSTINRSVLQDGETVKVSMTPGYVCNGTPASAEQLITIYAKPVAALTILAPEICPGQSTTLTATGGTVSGSSAITYTWSKNGPIPGNGDQLSVSEAGTYKVRITNGLSNCFSEASQTLIVQHVTVDAGPDQSMYQGESVILQGSSNGDYTYLWRPTNSLSDSSALKPKASPMLDTYYTITATSKIGCKATDEVLVQVFVPIRVPNAFSPNGDGLNDVWVIDGMEKFPHSHVNIYNRWGSTIYTDKNGYQVPWDGRNHGTQLPTGTYYYVIDLKGSPDNTDRSVTGSLTIVK